MADYIIGDIQACYDPLRRLLDGVGFDPAHDKLWAVGDLIGRGSHPLETLQFLHQLGNKFDCVLGNHDLHFLAVSQGIKSNKAEYGFNDVLASGALPTYVDWLRNKPLAIRLYKNNLLCHAGLYPGWRFKDAIRYSQEVQQVLSSEDWHQLLGEMYADYPAVWSDTLFGIERWRFIINSFTRMRYVNRDGELNFTLKTPLANAPSDLQGWFEHKRLRLKPHQRIYFGHWAALNGEVPNSQCIGLDTGCVWGKKLTMLKLDSQTYCSVKQ